MRRILCIAKKELLQIRRDRRMLPMIFIAPLLQVVLFGYVATTDVKEISLGVYDPAPEPRSPGNWWPKSRRPATFVYTAWRRVWTRSIRGWMRAGSR